MRQLGAVFLFAVAASGCSARSSPEASTRPPATQLVITGAQRTYTSPFPAQLKLTFGAKPAFQLSLEGVSDGQVWSLVTWPTAEQVMQGMVMAPVLNQEMSEGIATVALRSADGATNSQFSGSVALSASGGRLTGTVTSNPDSGAAAFSGSVSVSCWVPRSMLGATPVGGGTVGTAGDSEPLIEDSALASSQCAPLRGWGVK
jgi:hypothetical protein